MRTNLVIDDNLLKQAMRVSGLSTKGDVVNRALYEYVQNRTRRDLKELRGKIRFAEGYDYKLHREGSQDDTS